MVTHALGWQLLPLGALQATRVSHEVFEFAVRPGILLVPVPTRMTLPAPKGDASAVPKAAPTTAPAGHLPLHDGASGAAAHPLAICSWARVSVLALVRCPQSADEADRWDAVMLASGGLPIPPAAADRPATEEEVLACNLSGWEEMGELHETPVHDLEKEMLRCVVCP